MKENRTNVNLEARAKEMSAKVCGNYRVEQTAFDSTMVSAPPLYDAITDALLQFASEVREETISEIVQIVKDEEEPGAVDLSKEMLDVFLRTPGEALIGAIKATKKNLEKRILSLLPSTKEELK